MAEPATGLLESDNDIVNDVVALVTRHPIVFAQGLAEPPGVPANPYGDPETSDEAAVYLLGNTMREALHEM